MEEVVLVDEKDNQVGIKEKIKAHEDGDLHRAFSVFIFNSKGQLLLQKRADSKYHSGGLWTNTCCSHPRPGESVIDAAHRKLNQEMGFDCGLQEAASFIYRVKFENGLSENEYDHVLVGRFDGEPLPNPEEVGEYAWIGMQDLADELLNNPDKYTYWLKDLFNRNEILMELRNI